MTLQELKDLFTVHQWPKEQLHFVAIRNRWAGDDKFNDTLYMVSRHNGMWSFPCTTWPGKYYLLNPINPKGCGIIKAGQYPYLWTLGKHKDYEALVQGNPITVHRDNNRDEVGDLTDTLHTGMFGVNLHRAHKDWTSPLVGKWSAACIVVPNPTNFNTLLAMVKLSNQKYFTLTLFNSWK